MPTVTDRLIRRPLQRLAVLSNVPPLTMLFRAIYDLGLRLTLRALARHDAVRAVYGYGSFFDGRCLYGVSDIDLVIVIGEGHSRMDTVHHRIALTYTRLRRVFPFLQSWHEHAENLLFLSEIEAGFAIPEPLRLRLKQGRVVLLHGEPIPGIEPGEPVTLSEVVAEANSLLRIALMKGEVHASNQLFWKRLLAKLVDLAESLELGAVANRFRAREELDFLEDGDARLFLRRSDPDALFALLLEGAREIWDALSERTPVRTVHFTRFSPNGARPGPSPTGEAALPDRLRRALEPLASSVRTLAPPQLGLTPRTDAVPLDRRLPVVEPRGGGYRVLRSLARAYARHGDGVEAMLVGSGAMWFLYRRMPSFVDVIPLDPLLFSNVHARCRGREESFEMLRPLHEEQTAIAHRTFEALAGVYDRNTGWIQKLPFPCVYLEEDRIVVEDAIRRMRAYVMLADAVDVRSVDALIEYLGRRHPSCREFLEELLAYHRSLTDGRPDAPPANNLYTCLLQFVSQLLAGRQEILLAPPRRHLGITVGIITRNRARDLTDALAALTRQRRRPDEVLVVDNGSTDETAEVADRYRTRLPLRYRYLAEASIPRARNLVLDEARNDVISFTDDDCIPEPGWLEAVERGFLRAENVGIVGGWVWHEPSREPGALDTYYGIFHHSKT